MPEQQNINWLINMQTVQYLDQVLRARPMSESEPVVQSLRQAVQQAQMPVPTAVPTPDSEPDAA